MRWVTQGCGSDGPWTRHSLLLAIVAGVLAWLGFAGMGVWPLAFVAYVPLFLALDVARRKGWKSVMLHAFVFGLLAWAGGYSWMLPTLERFSGLSFVASLATALLFWSVQAGHAVLFGLLWAGLRHRGWGPVAAAAVSFGVAEFSYPQMFPSYYAASLHTLTPLIQLAEVGGPLLLSVLLIAVNGALYAIVVPSATSVQWRWAGPLVVAGVVGCSLVYGTVRVGQVGREVQEAKTLRVGLVQANLPATAPGKRPAGRLARHLALSADVLRTGPVDLLIWPESSCETTLEFPRDSVREPAGWGVPAPILFGSPTRDTVDGVSRKHNSAILAGANGRVLGRYDKNRLVAFSERNPLAAWGFTPPGAVPDGVGFTAGRTHDALMIRKTPISVLICFEDILPDYVRQVAATASPQLFVNLTNDAWFGRSAEPRIHAALARFRAVEHRISLVRATNTGLTVVYGPDGRELARAPTHEATTMIVDVPLLQVRQTPYARFGDFVGWICIALAGIGLLPRRRPAKSVDRQA